MDELWLIFKNLGKEALVLNHYDLEERTGIEASLWKYFLMEQEVQDWIKSENKLIQESELKKLVKDVSKSRSVGQAQIMNTLAKMNDEKTVKEGPIFIYTYVPMNAEQRNASNTKEADHDIFMKGE